MFLRFIFLESWLGSDPCCSFNWGALCCVFVSNFLFCKENSWLFGLMIEFCMGFGLRGLGLGFVLNWSGDWILIWWFKWVLEIGTQFIPNLLWDSFQFHLVPSFCVCLVIGWVQLECSTIAMIVTETGVSAWKPYIVCLIVYININLSNRCLVWSNEWSLPSPPNE